MIEYNVNEPNTLDVNEVLSFLKETDDLVIPSMSSLCDLDEYAHKITSKAVIFTAREESKLIGLTAIYFNRAPEYSYSTYTMVKREYQLVEMVGVEMSNRVRDYVKGNGSAGLRYEIRKSNKPLLRYHLRRGAKILEERLYPGTDIVSLLMEITY